MKPLAYLASGISIFLASNCEGQASPSPAAPAISKTKIVSTDHGSKNALEDSLARMLRGKADLSWLLTEEGFSKVRPSEEDHTEARSIIALAQVARSRGLDQRDDTLSAMNTLETAVLAEAARRDLLDSIKLTDDDIGAAMKAAPGRYDEYRLSHIFVAVGRTPDGGERTETAARALATSLKGEIAGGSDFAAVAKRSSEDASTADEGGELSSMFGRYVANEFFPYVRSLANGAVSDPIRGVNGYHLVRLDERIPATVATARFMVTDDIRSRKMPGLIAEAIRGARP